MLSHVWLYSIGATLLVSLISLAGLFVFGVRTKVVERWMIFFVALSVGALFGDVFFHILPELVEDSVNVPRMFALVLVGILVFFALEKLLRWRHTHDMHAHCEGPECPVEVVQPLGKMVLFSDGLHNLIDGVVIGASFLISIPVGVATTVAVALHEIPQEIGDFGVLLHAGFTRGKALLYNLLSGLVAIIGVVAVLILEVQISNILPSILALAAGGFIYLAGSDLVPELHKGEVHVKNAVLQFIALLAGAAAMYGLTFIEFV